MSAIATKGESVGDTLSEEPIVSGEETKRTATTADSDGNKESSSEAPLQNGSTKEAEEKSESVSQSEKDESDSSSSKQESESSSESTDNSGSN